MDTSALTEIIKIGKYDYYGIRVIDTDTVPDVGSPVEPSHVWTDEGEWTEETMDGASALRVSWDTVELIIARSTYYAGSVVVLLGSNGIDGGQDHGEIVMRNATVLTAWVR